MIYDLHTHSNASDGILSPEALVSRAKDKGVTHLAITDHDTLAGLDAVSPLADGHELSLIPGIEFSTQWQGRGVHIVGLNFDPQALSLRGAVAQQLDVRAWRAEEIARKLLKLGMPNALAGAKKYAGNGVIGRPHFAQHLVAEGHVTSVNQAFQRYLGAGKAGDVKNIWLSLDEVVQAITTAGGTAVLAHPIKYKLTGTKLRQLVEAFKEAGGTAIEVISGSQTANDTGNLAALSRRYELYASCGSDFHAPNSPWQELGAFGKLPSGCQPVWHSWQ